MTQEKIWKIIFLLINVKLWFIQELIMLLFSEQERSDMQFAVGDRTCVNYHTLANIIKQSTYFEIRNLISSTMVITFNQTHLRCELPSEWVDNWAESIANFTPNPICKLINKTLNYTKFIIKSSDAHETSLDFKKKIGIKPPILWL